MTADLETMFRSLQTSIAAHRPGTDVDRDRDPCSEELAVPVPVTVVTGFLGAGKTTLLTAVLQNPPSGSVVRAVVNDVGELGLDPTLFTADGPLEVELSNGCGCCAINDDLAAALDRTAALEPDIILLEASGVTDPFAIAQIVEASPHLHLDRTVAVIDALLLTQLRSRHEVLWPELGAAVGPIVGRQLAAADAVVVSRADLVEEAMLTDLLAHLADALPGRTITPSSIDSPAARVLLPGSVRGAALPSSDSPIEHPIGDEHIVATTFEQRTTITGERLAQVMDALPHSILRCKGIVSTHDGPMTVQSTASGKTISPAPALPWRPTNPASADAIGRITIVGTDNAAACTLAVRLGC